MSIAQKKFVGISLLIGYPSPIDRQEPCEVAENAVVHRKNRSHRKIVNLSDDTASKQTQKASLENFETSNTLGKSDKLTVR
jgi:hypothetical protein